MLSSVTADKYDYIGYFSTDIEIVPTLLEIKSTVTILMAYNNFVNIGNYYNVGNIDNKYFNMYYLIVRDCQFFHTVAHIT